MFYKYHSCHIWIVSRQQHAKYLSYPNTANKTIIHHLQMSKFTAYFHVECLSSAAVLFSPFLAFSAYVEILSAFFAIWTILILHTLYFWVCHAFFLFIPTRSHFVGVSLHSLHIIQVRIWICSSFPLSNLSSILIVYVHFLLSLFLTLTLFFSFSLSLSFSPSLSYSLGLLVSLGLFFYLARTREGGGSACSPTRGSSVTILHRSQ